MASPPGRSHSDVTRTEKDDYRGRWVFETFRDSISRQRL